MQSWIDRCRDNICIAMTTMLKSASGVQQLLEQAKHLLVNLWTLPVLQWLSVVMVTSWSDAEHVVRHVAMVMKEARARGCHGGGIFCGGLQN